MPPPKVTSPIMLDHNESNHKDIQDKGFLKNIYKYV